MYWACGVGKNWWEYFKLNHTMYTREVLSAILKKLVRVPILPSERGNLSDTAAHVWQEFLVKHGVPHLSRSLRFSWSIFGALFQRGPVPWTFIISGMQIKLIGCILNLRPFSTVASNEREDRDLQRSKIVWHFHPTFTMCKPHFAELLVNVS